MEQAGNTSASEPDKAAIDASEPGSLTISADSSARIAPSFVSEAFLQLQQRIEKKNGLVLSPLRLVLLTAELPNAVRRWQRSLSLPESSVSQQPEGSAVAKTFSWGRDVESARSLIILADYIAAALVANNCFAIAAVAHEFGHVHDNLSRGVVLGFRESDFNPAVNDWPGIREQLAEIVWSEYMAESIAAGYLTGEDLLAFLLNDPLHLAGIDKRLRQAVWSYKSGQRTLDSLWQESVTGLSDILANLGRTIARLEFVDNYEEGLSRLVQPNSEKTRWRPVIEHFVRELKVLGNTAYNKWGSAPFNGIREIVGEAFNSVGLFPSYDGRKLLVRVV